VKPALLISLVFCIVLFILFVVIMCLVPIVASNSGSSILCKDGGVVELWVWCLPHRKEEI
jgi:hypothetical protein